MFMKTKRILVLILAFCMLLSALSLSSCNNNDTPEETTENEQTEAPAVLGDFKITEEVRIIYPDKTDMTVKNACKMIAQAIFDTYGITVKVSSDWNAANGPEILVGNCGYRESSVKFNERFYTNGYGYAVLSETEIAISARTTENVYRAAKLFIEELIQKTPEPAFGIGTEYLKNNQKPAALYTLNGVGLEEYTIVADKADDKVAAYIAKTIKDNLTIELKVVAASSFGGGHAIKVGDFGCNSYGGVRYRLRSESVGGTSTVYVDGQTDVLREKAAQFLCENYLFTKLAKADFTVPASIYKYRWSSGTTNTGTYLNKIVKTQELAEGVTYYQFKYNNKDESNVDVYAIVVDGDSKAEFRVWAGDMSHIDSDKEVFDVKTVGAQAKELEQTTGENVIAAINAAYFRKTVGTNKPYTMRIVRGEVLCPPLIVTDTSARPDTWIGITYDGKLVCGDKASYESTWVGKLEYAVATGVHMMIDGKVNFSGNIDINPLTAVATTADGGFVMVCADGRSAMSAGATSADMLGFMLDLEAFHPDIKYVNVYTLDGGGSTEMVIEGKNGFTTVNDPSDGKSRPVGDIIAVSIPKN